MPRDTKRFIYDDDGEQMLEGSKVLVNGKIECIIHFNDEGDIDIAGVHPEDIETVEAIPDNRYEDIEDCRISDNC